MYIRMYAGTDYTTGLLTVTFLPGVPSSSRVFISIVDDDIFEANETIIFTIGPGSRPRVTGQSDCMLTITIVDNDGGE